MGPWSLTGDASGGPLCSPALHVANGNEGARRFYVPERFFEAEVLAHQTLYLFDLRSA